MAHIEPGPGRTELHEGETVITEFRPDPQVYWRAHLVMAVILGVAAGVVLLWLQNPYPVAGPVGVVLAIAARAAFVQRTEMAEVWHLTNRRLLGPRGQAVALAQLLSAQPAFGAVQLVSSTGDKHLMKHQSDPAAVSYLLLTAAGRKGKLRG